MLFINEVAPFNMPVGALRHVFNPDWRRSAAIGLKDEKSSASASTTMQPVEDFQRMRE
jgi:hypothetical protein